MMKSASVLSLERLTVSSLKTEDTWTLNAELAPGGVFDFPESDGPLAWIADIIAGLDDPNSGTVLWKGQDVSSLSPSEGNVFRSGMRRIFRSGGWLSNLDLDENLLLASRYHNWASDVELEEEAHKIAERLGLEIPSCRPAQLSEEQAYGLQWVRAFMGIPEIMLVEIPASGVPNGLLDSALPLLKQRLKEGMILIWLGGSLPAVLEP